MAYANFAFYLTLEKTARYLDVAFIYIVLLNPVSIFAANSLIWGGRDKNKLLLFRYIHFPKRYT